MEKESGIIFQLYPDNEPNFAGVHYLVIIKFLNSYSYAFRYFNNNLEFEPKKQDEVICAFCEVAPIEIMIQLDQITKKD